MAKGTPLNPTAESQGECVEAWVAHVNILNKLRVVLTYDSQEKLTKAQEVIEGLIKEASQTVGY